MQPIKSFHVAEITSWWQGQDQKNNTSDFRLCVLVAACRRALYAYTMYIIHNMYCCSMWLRASRPNAHMKLIVCEYTGTSR